jgi:MoaD family protein
MTVAIHIPTPLRKFTEDQDTVEVEGSNVGEALEHLTERYPDLRGRLFTDDDEVRRFVNIFANDEDIRFQEQLDTNLEDGDEVSIVPAIAGG